MELYCRILDKDCIKESCTQYNSKLTGLGCELYTQIGHFLYHSASPVEEVSFIRYLEDIRPIEISCKKFGGINEEI